MSLLAASAGACRDGGSVPPLIDAGPSANIALESGDAQARELEPPLALRPILVDLRTPYGTKTSADVSMIGKLARDAKLVVARVEGSGIDDPTVVAGDGGGPALLRLSLAGQRVGDGVGRVFISTGLVHPSELIVSYSWRVTGNLEVSPEKPYINLRDPGPKKVVLRVTSRRPDFRLHAALVDEGPFEARFHRDEAASAYSVEVRAVEERIPPGERGVFGRIVLVSNDAAEPRRNVAVFALGVVHLDRERD